MYSYSSRVGVLLLTLAHGHRIYRWQFIVLVLAIVAPMIGGVADVMGLSPPYLPRTGIAVTVLALTSPIVIWGLYRIRVDDIVPIARDRIIEVMGDAVIVLDGQQRIIDLNSKCAGVIRSQGGENYWRSNDHTVARVGWD